MVIYMIIMVHHEATPNPEAIFQPGAPAHAAFDYLASLGREIPDTPAGSTMWELFIVADTGELSTPLNYAVLHHQETEGRLGGQWACLRVYVGRKVGWTPEFVRRSPMHYAVRGSEGYEDSPMTNDAFLGELRFVWDHLSALPPLP